MCSSHKYLKIYKAVQSSQQYILGCLNCPTPKITQMGQWCPICSISPIPRQILIYFLFLWICQFWTFYINGILQYLVFHDGVLLFFTMFSGFILIVACISIFFPFFCHIICHYMDIPHFVYTFINWWAFGVFPSLPVMNNAAMNICV